MNEALILGSVRQHELTEASERLNAQLRAEIQAREKIAAELSETARELADKARLLDLTHDAIIVRDVEGRIRYWNRGAERLYGWTFREAVGKVSNDLLKTEFPISLEQMVEELHRTGRWTGELVHTTRDGRRLTVFVRKTLERDQVGNPASVLENITNITERHRVEQALRVSEARYRTLFDLSPVGVYSCDASGTIQQFNRHAVQLWGREPALDDPAERFCGSVKMLRPDGSVMLREQCPMADVLSGRIAEVRDAEVCLKRPDGSLVTVVVNIRPLKDHSGEVTGAINCFYDITARKQAEEALRISEDFNRSIIDSSPDCIKILDLEGNLLSMETGQDLLGIVDVAPFLQKPWIDFWEDKIDRAAALAAMQAAVAGGEGSFVGFFRTLRGEPKWWNVAISPIRGAEGRPVRLLAVSRDVTERRLLEESLVKRAEDLARADRSKDDFLAMLAHELRNPLAPLRNAGELLGIENATADERLQAQRIIHRQVENMSRMLDDLLDVSRITVGKIDLRKEPVPLEGILTAAASLVRSSCSTRKQNLAVSLPEDPVYLDADATRLEQVFGNLLTNASKYSGEGSHISISAERVPGAEPPEVMIIVRDDGVGISPELLPRIFDLFVQATRALDRASGGLGIGLTLVQRLVNLHGGNVEAHSEGVGRGSEFIVHLPILRKAPPAPFLPPIIAIENPRRILIVDDNTDAARSLAMLQGRRGHHTCTAFTGPDALVAAVAFKPEVVVLDIGLPGMDGFEVGRRIRAMPALAGVCLIAMSGYGSPEDRATAKEAGFDEYLVKPVDLAEFQELLAKRP